jgi:hypothetical protein
MLRRQGERSWNLNEERREENEMVREEALL